MKLRLVILLTVAAGLAVWLVLDWRANHPHPAIDNLDFVPVVRGLKPKSGNGDLIKGRLDLFDINIPFEDVRRQMRVARWREQNLAVASSFTPPAPIEGYGVVQVLVVDPKYPQGFGIKGLCGVYVTRRIAPISAAEKRAQARDQARHAAAAAREHEIVQRLEKEHRLRSEDLDFMLQSIQSRSVDGHGDIGAYFAAINLDFAIREKLCAPGRVLAIYERNMVSSEPSEVRLWLAYLEQALTIGASPDKLLYEEARGIRDKGKELHAIDPEERGFITRAMSSNLNRDAVLAAEVFVPKIGLDQDTVKWLKGRVNDRLRKSTGDAKLFWQCVRRVTATRNSQAPKP